MRKLSVFNNVSLDGYFTDANGDMSVFHRRSDAEWGQFSSDNARNGHSSLVFGRKTYDLMKSFWPTEMAKQQMPEIAEGMTRMEKIVFSRTLKDPGWANARVIQGDLAAEMKKLKQGDGEPMLIMGSGQIISQLTKERLIDSYQIVIWPFLMGTGRTMFEGLETIVDLKKVDERQFKNGNIVVTYELAQS